MEASENVKRVAMFLVGFTMLSAFLLPLSCANYSIKRFQLPVERVGLFINITQNTMELVVFFSALIGNIIIWLSKGDDKGEGKCQGNDKCEDKKEEKEKEKDNNKDKDNKNSVPKICSLFTNWLMFVMSIMSLVAYKSGGDSGNLNFYFWTIVLHVFVCVINFIFSVEVDPDNVTYIYVGRPLLSIFISVYHNIFLYFVNKYEMDNIDYWIVYGQMVLMIIFTCATALLWTYSTNSDKFAAFISCIQSKFGSGSQTASCESSSSAQSQSQAQEQTLPSREQESTSSKCCCCCCVECRKSCTSTCTGGQECTCCKAGKCCTASCPGPDPYKCCCCKSPGNPCPCPGQQQKVEEEEECQCCCCTTSEDSKPAASTQAKQDEASGSSSEGNKSNGKLWDELKEPLLWSPAMILIFATGTMYSVYPGVFPYQLVSADVGYKIGLISLILSPIMPIIICILDMHCHGPSKEWKDGSNIGWHAVWAGPIFAIICIFLFIYTLHYPESMIGRNIYGNNILVGLLTVSFVMVQEGLKAVGSAPTKSQVKCEVNKGNISTIIYLISSVLANASGFISDGYLKTYRKYSRDNWPTRGYTRYRGFKFWFGSACKVAGESILNVFNSDIRARIESFS